MSQGDRIAVVFGGRSVEHEVSLRSARTVMGALDEAGFDPVPVAVTREGAWRSGEDARTLLDAAGAGTPGDDCILAPDPAFRGLVSPGSGGGWRSVPVDVVFPLIHGFGGEDGTLQGLLELAGLPYVGSGVTASALGMDKRLQRRLFRAAGLPVLPTVEVHRRDWERDPAAQERRIQEGVGVPCFVKPSCSGSSVGVGKAHSAGELAALVTDAARYDEVVLAEPARPVRELEIAVLGNHEARASGPGEILPGREFYDYRAKYLEDTSELLIPAPVDAATAAELGRLALEAFRCLGCSGLARVDFFMEPEGGSLWINEINTLPGFTSISMYPRLWSHEGIDLPDLVGRLVALGRERHREAGRSRRSLPTREG